MLLEAAQHARDLSIFVDPRRGYCDLDLTEVTSVVAPQARFGGRSNRYREEASELDGRNRAPP